MIYVRLPGRIAKLRVRFVMQAWGVAFQREVALKRGYVVMAKLMEQDHALVTTDTVIMKLNVQTTHAVTVFARIRFHLVASLIVAVPSLELGSPVLVWVVFVVI
jgi:hypothetical protein